ncbi:MAG: AarF/UbiB family protein, partial [Actinomycetota bacterium]
MTSPVHTPSSPLPDGAPADLAWGAFHETAPWTLDPATITWKEIAGELRTSAQREIPVLTTPTKVPPFARLITVVWVLSSALVPWFVKKKFSRFSTPEESRAYISLRMRKAVERLGSTYIKLGQIISSGEGLFPAELVAEFKLCRDQVPASPFDEVRRVVEEELGATLEQTFARFDRTPLAAASIAQVHVATLKTGEEVVVKVQRPVVSTLVRKDLRVMAWL